MHKRKIVKVICSMDLIFSRIAQDNFHFLSYNGAWDDENIKKLSSFFPFVKGGECCWKIIFRAKESSPKKDSFLRNTAFLVEKEDDQSRWEKYGKQTWHFLDSIMIFEKIFWDKCWRQGGRWSFWFLMLKVNQRQLKFRKEENLNKSVH